MTPETPDGQLLITQLEAQCLKFHNRSPMAICREAVDEHGRPHCIICQAAAQAAAAMRVLQSRAEDADTLRPQHGESGIVADTEVPVTSLSQPSRSDAPVMEGAGLIAAERARQVSVEGWTAAHDDEHENGELLSAAVWYLDNGCEFDLGLTLPPWPWEPAWWKPSDDRVRQLTKAGALIAAEIDRLQRRDGTARQSVNESPFIDTPVLKAKRAAFDNPTQSTELPADLRVVVLRRFVDGAAILAMARGQRYQLLDGQRLTELEAQLAALQGVSDPIKE